MLSRRGARAPRAAAERARAQAAVPFRGIVEVREVPLAVLDRLHPVPAAFLKQARAARRRLRAAAPWRSTEPQPVAAGGRHGAVPAAAVRRAAAGACLCRGRGGAPPRLADGAWQVWELDGTLFRRHATPSLHAYAEETATIMRELDMARARARLPRPGEMR